MLSFLLFRKPIEHVNFITTIFKYTSLGNCAVNFFKTRTAYVKWSITTVIRKIWKDHHHLIRSKTVATDNEMYQVTEQDSNENNVVDLFVVIRRFYFVVSFWTRL